MSHLNESNKFRLEEIFKWLSNGNSTSFNGLNRTRHNVPANIYKGETISTLIRIYAWTAVSVSVLGIIGNLLVLLVYLKKFREITPFKFLISHLAICDLMFSDSTGHQIVVFITSINPIQSRLFLLFKDPGRSLGTHPKISGTTKGSPM